MHPRGTARNRDFSREKSSDVAMTTVPPLVHTYGGSDALLYETSPGHPWGKRMKMPSSISGESNLAQRHSDTRRHQDASNQSI